MSNYLIHTKKTLLLLVMFFGITGVLHAQTDPSYFVITVRVTASHPTFKLPIFGSSFDVDWDNDGIFDSFGLNGQTTHNYGAEGTYTIQVKGNYNNIKFANQGDRGKLIDIVQWGTNVWTTFDRAFTGCYALNTITATDAPDLSNVTNFRQIFQNCYSFNSDIGHWDVSNVRDFYRAFRNIGFNNGGSPSINNWDVSGATSFNEMFYDADQFNQPIGNWRPTSVTNVTNMFSYASRFNQNIGDWRLISVQNYYRMFRYATRFNNGGDPSINDWDVSGATSFSQMFDNAHAFNQPIGNWDVSNLRNTSNMFANARAFNQPLDGWVTTSLENTSNMFNNAHAFNQTFGGWVTSSLTNTSNMFNNARSFNQDISHFDMSNVTTTASMFNDAHSFNNGGSPDITNWDVGNVENMNNMFADARSFNQPLANWRPTSATNVSSMFIDASSFNQNLGDWGLATGSFENMHRMFRSATSFNNGGDPGINNWDVSSATVMSETFFDAQSFNQPLGSWNTISVENTTSMFNKAYIFNQNLSLWNLESLTTMTSMFENAHAFNNDGDPGINDWDVADVTSFYKVFAEARVFNQPIGGWDTGIATNMSAMFYRAYQFNQNLSLWDTGMVTQMNDMFESASVFDNLGDDAIGNWDVRSVIEMHEMFNTATVFNRDISSWTLDSLERMTGMFRVASAFNQNLSSWNVSQVNSFDSVFELATAFDNLGDDSINTWDISSATSIKEMFNGASVFNRDITGWDVSGYTDMRSTFNNATSFDYSLASWDIGNITHATDMLDNSGVSSQNWDATLIAWHAQNFTNANVTIGAQNLMFCTALVQRDEMQDNGIFNFNGDRYCLSPGGLTSISGTYLWYTATSGAYKSAMTNDLAADGEDVVRWTDNTVGLVNANTVSGTTPPTFVENALNFNPGISLNNASLETERVVLGSGNPQHMIFGVFASAVAEQEGVFFSTGNDTATQIKSFSIGTDIGPLFKYDVNGSHVTTNTFSKLANIGEANLFAMYYKTFGNNSYGHQVKFYDANNVQPNVASLQPPSRIGLPSDRAHRIGSRVDSSLPYNGVLAELIVLPYYSNDTDIGYVNSYLAIKYGIHMPYHSYSTKSTGLFWNRSQNITYHHDVAGIFRDDTTALHQKISRSQNDDAIVTISTHGSTPDFISFNGDSTRSDIPNNESGLVWGNNNIASDDFSLNGLTNTPFGGSLSPGTKRWSRVWYAQATNFTEHVNIQFESPFIGNNENYIFYLITETDGDRDFSNDGVVENEGSPSFAQNGIVVFENVDLNNKYFTIARQEYKPMRHGKKFLNSKEQPMLFVK